MADRKISELNLASKVHDADYMVVVTGVGQLVPGQENVFKEKITTKFPLSGLSTWIFRVNEVVSGVSGIHVVPIINTGSNPATSSPNTVTLSTTGVSFVGHTHTVSNITDFTNGVSNLVHQKLNYLDSDTSTSVAGELITLSGLSINLDPGTQYVCELGLIMSGNNSNITGLVSSTGIVATNGNLLSAHGTWNYISGNTIYNSSSSITGSYEIGNSIDSIKTLVNKFTISTYEQEADQINIQFTSDNTDGKILQGSWFKTEKVI